MPCPGLTSLSCERRVNANNAMRAKTSTSGCLALGITLFCALIASGVVAGCKSVEHDPELPAMALERAGVSPFGNVRLELAGTIGSETNEDYLFSSVRGVAVDNDDNAVVLDAIMNNLRVFDPNGTLIRKYSLQEGEGPGEFQHPSTFSLSHDKERVYLYDMGNRRITILDYATFDYIRQIAIPETQHVIIQDGPDNTIVALFSQLDVSSRPLVHVFSETGSRLASFERRHSEFRTYLDQNLQVFEDVSMARSDSLVVLSFALPYDIRIYNRQYEPVSRFHLTPDFFGGTVQDGEWLYPSGYCTDLVVAGENLLLQFLWDRTTDEQWMHAFDLSGRSRGMQRMVNNAWGDSFGIFSGSLDSSGHIYGVAYEPFPMVIRLKVVAIDA